ncbi:hypothetical protein P4G96_04080 [Bacillus cereus]|nr:hypothetical protein [Bacillus cereus]MEB8666860.1 hypothetical protein [Bacillus cereus]
MNFKDVTEIFTDYANQWSKQNGGGEVEISLILPGYEPYAVKSSTSITKYHSKKRKNKSHCHHSTEHKRHEFEDDFYLSAHHPIKGKKREIILASETYLNTGCHEKKVKIDLEGKVKSSGEWKILDGATLSGNAPIFVNTDGHKQVSIDQTNPLSLYIGKTEKLEGLDFITTNRHFTIRPRFQITATLKAKEKHFTQLFDVETDLSGYVVILQKQKDGNVKKSFHHVGAILQRYYSPYIQVNESNVTLLSKGTFKATTLEDFYIHVKAQSIDIPDLMEEFNIYDIIESLPVPSYENV